MQPEILVVDDDASVAATLCGLVGELGLPPAVRADGGLRALELMAATPFKVAILDLDLPDMPGDELFRRIRAASPSTEVVFLTGTECIERATTLLREGAADYLVKPVGNDLVAASLRGALRKHEIATKKDLLIKKLMEKTTRLTAQLGEQQKALAAQATTAPEPAGSVEAERLRTALQERDRRIGELEGRLASTRSETERQLAELGSAKGIVYPSRAFAISNTVFLAVAVLSLVTGLAGYRFLPVPRWRTMFIAQAFIVAMLFFEGALLVKLSSLLRYFALNPGDGEHPSTLRRLMTHGVAIFSTLAGVFMTLALVQAAPAVLGSHGKARDAGPILRYLESGVVRDASTLSLITASIFLLGAAVVAVALINDRYLGTLRDRSTRSSTRDRLQGLDSL